MPDSKTQRFKISFMSLDPGHFHAALVHKEMYEDVDSTIYVYAPEGPELKDFLGKISAYNRRGESPTAWTVKSYNGSDYLNKMISEKPGDVMIVAGKNSKKIDYILEAVRAGLNVYADKPLVITRDGYHKLKEAFAIAKQNEVLIYDIMTERFEVTTAMQKWLSTLPELFGELKVGSLEEPAISKESVHHFFKYVSGTPLVRPPWFFDVNEEGEGTVDVTTHLVDLIQWEAFPEEIIDTTDIEMLSAKRWPTMLSRTDFSAVTGLTKFPDFLMKNVRYSSLAVFCNGEMNYKIRGKHAKVSVSWKFRAPEGTGDTHYSIMRGTGSDLIIKQGEEENYKPLLYISINGKVALSKTLEDKVTMHMNKKFPGTTLRKVAKNTYAVQIPEALKVGHEAHFAQVTRNYLNYLTVRELPEWEVPNMIAKYYTTTKAYELSRASNTN